MATRKAPARTPDGTSPLDSLFGFRTITVGDASLTIRRMLTRKQSRAVQRTYVSVVEAQTLLKDKLAEMSDAQAEQAEDELCDQLASICRLLYITEVPWDEMGLVTLADFVGRARQAMAEAEDTELQGLPVPTNAG